jgi:hypothetical protein
LRDTATKAAYFSFERRMSLSFLATDSGFVVGLYGLWVAPAAVPAVESRHRWGKHASLGVGRTRKLSERLWKSSLSEVLKK